MSAWLFHTHGTFSEFANTTYNYNVVYSCLFGSFLAARKARLCRNPAAMSRL